MIGALLSLIVLVFFNFAPCLIWDKSALRSVCIGSQFLVKDKVGPEEKGGGGAGGGGGKGGIIKFNFN